MKYSEALEWLYATQTFGIKLGLEHPRRILAALGNPQERTPFLHVAGTNGKGSVCAFAASVLRRAGYRTGLFTSPHLVDFRERIQLDGRKIPREEVAAGLGRLREVTGGWKDPPTFFEVVTSLALDWFAGRGAEAVVLETGMGGRLDATNIVAPKVCVITPISLDHQQWLGGGLREIAREKAGIIKAGVPVVVMPQEPEAGEVVRERAAEVGAPVFEVSAPWEGGSLPLRGRHQMWNAAAAVAACRLFDGGITEEEVKRGLEAARWPGRFERIGERFVLDGAHNPGAVKALAATWREEFPGEKATVIFGALRDKLHGELLAGLDPLAARFLFVAVRSARGADPREFRAPSAPAEVRPSLADAIAEARRRPERILIAGSLFLVGEALALLRARRPPKRSAQ